MAVQAQTALLARVTGRPVKLRADARGVASASTRSATRSRCTTRSAADANGRLTAVKARMLGDSGAYACVGGRCSSALPATRAARTTSRTSTSKPIAAYTNNVPCGALRGFGANQAQFAMEGAIDLLAEKMGVDRWEIRYLNALEVGHIFSSGQVLEKCVGLKKTLLAVKPAYEAARAAGKAVGIACGIKNSGIGNGAARVGEGPPRRRARRAGQPLQRLHRDGARAPHGARAVRGRGDGARGKGVPREGRLHVPARVRADDRLARDAARRTRRGDRRRRSSAQTSTRG